MEDRSKGRNCRPAEIRLCDSESRLAKAGRAESEKTDRARDCLGIGLQPEQVFFVDDWPPLVKGAIEMGMDGAVITREEDPERPPHPFDSADDLRGILKLIQAR